MSNPFSRALDAGQFYVGKICTTCLFAHEYGEYSETMDTDEWNVEIYNRNRAEYDVTMGHPHFQTEWFDDCPHAGESCPDDADCDCERSERSRSTCDLCGSPYHGERHDAIFIKRSLLAQS